MGYTSRKDVINIKVWGEEELREMQAIWKKNNFYRYREKSKEYAKKYRETHVRKRKESKLSPTQKAIREEYKRARELGLCSRCKVNPRKKLTCTKSTWCWPCILETQKKSRKRKTLQKRLDLLAKFNFECIVCGTKIEKAVTRKNKVRYVCQPCFVAIRKKFGRRSGKELHRLIELAKMQFEVVPKDVLKMIPQAKRGNTLM